MSNDDNILNDFSVLENLDQQVKDADDNLVEALKQNEDRLYDVVKVTLPVPVLNFSLIFNKEIADIILAKFVMIAMYCSIIGCYGVGVILYGISYFLGTWDVERKRVMLSEYKTAPNVNNINSLVSFLKSYQFSGKILKIANRCKNISILFVTLGFIIFIGFICVLLYDKGMNMSNNNQKNGIIGSSFVADSVPIKGIKGNEFTKLAEQLKQQSPAQTNNMQVSQPAKSLSNNFKK